MDFWEQVIQDKQQAEQEVQQLTANNIVLRGNFENAYENCRQQMSNFKNENLTPAIQAQCLDTFHADLDPAKYGLTNASECTDCLIYSIQLNELTDKALAREKEILDDMQKCNLCAHLPREPFVEDPVFEVALSTKENIGVTKDRIFNERPVNFVGAVSWWHLVFGIIVIISMITQKIETNHATTVYGFSLILTALSTFFGAKCTVADQGFESLYDGTKVFAIIAFVISCLSHIAIGALYVYKAWLGLSSMMLWGIAICSCFFGCIFAYAKVFGVILFAVETAFMVIFCSIYYEIRHKKVNKRNDAIYQSWKKRSADGIRGFRVVTNDYASQIPKSINTLNNLVVAYQKCVDTIKKLQYTRVLFAQNVCNLPFLEDEKTSKDVLHKLQTGEAKEYSVALQLVSRDRQIAALEQANIELRKEQENLRLQQAQQHAEMQVKMQEMREANDRAMAQQVAATERQTKELKKELEGIGAQVSSLQNTVASSSTVSDYEIRAAVEDALKKL